MLLALLSIGFWISCLFPSLLVALIISLLLAFVLRPPVRFLEIHFGMHRTLSIACVFLLILGFLLFNAANGLPVLLDHTRELYSGFKNFPIDQKLDELVRDLVKGIPIVDPQAASEKVRLFFKSSMQSAGQDLAATAGSAFSFLIVPFVTYFALSEGDKAMKRLLERVPNKYFEMTLNVVDKIQRELVGYLRGWILDSVVVGVLNIIGFYLLGVKYAVLMGVIAGFANLIPYVGPFIGIAPVFLVCITQTGDLSLIPPVALLTIVIQTIDNIVIQPLCFAKTVDIHPVTVIVVCIVGNEMMGILGMLLAIPLYTILKVTAVESYWGLKHYRITT